MNKIITLEEVTNQDYPIQYLSSPNTSIQEIDISYFLINFHFNLTRLNIRRSSFFNLTSIFETDLSSIWPHFEIKNETTLLKETLAEEFIEDMFEFDITVRIPPKKEWAAQVKVKSLGKAIPHIVEPEEF